MVGRRRRSLNPLAGLPPSVRFRIIDFNYRFYRSVLLQYCSEINPTLGGRRCASIYFDRPRATRLHRRLRPTPQGRAGNTEDGCGPSDGQASLRYTPRTYRATHRHDIRYADRLRCVAPRERARDAGSRCTQGVCDGFRNKCCSFTVPCSGNPAHLRIIREKSSIRRATSASDIHAGGDCQWIP